MALFHLSPCRVLGATVILFIAGGAPRVDGQTQWDMNNHVYEYVSTPMSWEEARATAAGMSFGGVPGHLATVTSLAENAFLVSQFPTQSSPWLGGEQPPGSVEPAGGFRWITGEPFVFTAWRAGEPNNGGAGEEVIAYSAPNPDLWNDFPNRSDFLRPFLVEYDLPTVPERRVINGHHYQIVWTFLDWTAARNAAATLTLDGEPGHLATVTSLAENAFLSGRFHTSMAAWLGGEQPPGSIEPDGGWQWVTGEAFEFEAWGPGEPNDSNTLGPSEEAIAYFAAFPTTWNDLPSSSSVVRPFLVEFETPLGECFSDLPGLVSWWRGEANIADNGGDANGSTLGTTQFERGVVGSGFTFDDDADGVVIPANPRLDIGPSGFSVALWMQGLGTQPGPIFTVLDKSFGFVDTSGWAIEGNSSDGSVRFVIGTGLDTDPAILSSPLGVLDGEYHFVVGSWDGQTVRLHVDGLLQDSQAASVVADNSRDLVFGFAEGGGAPQSFFRGLVDEVQIFSRALTDGEIQVVHTTGGAGLCTKEPVARAGDDQTVFEGDLAQLDGTASFDSEERPLTFQWTLLAGPSVSFDATSPQPTFLAPVVALGGATLTFQLVVNDGLLSSTPAITNVIVKNVNGMPVADAGPDQTVAEGAIATLDGSGSFDPDDEPLFFEWQQTAGPLVLLDDPFVPQPTFLVPFVAPGGQTVRFELQVTDGIDTASDSVDVLIQSVNQVPIADAGPDLTVDELTFVQLDATASSDPDGDVLCFEWTQVSGPGVELCDRFTATPSFCAPAVAQGEKTLEFEVVVNDLFGGFDSDRVIVTVRDVNAPPDCSRARASRRLLWPPNHKMVPVRILGVTDPDDRRVKIEITSVTQDEPVTGHVSGDTGPDAVIRGRTVLLRREVDRSGNGRVYRVHFTATDRSGASCSSFVDVCVPTSWKKWRQPCIDDGQLYDSTGN